MPYELNAPPGVKPLDSGIGWAYYCLLGLIGFAIRDGLNWWRRRRKGDHLYVRACKAGTWRLWTRATARLPLRWTVLGCLYTQAQTDLGMVASTALYSAGPERIQDLAVPRSAKTKERRRGLPGGAPGTR